MSRVFMSAGEPSGVAIGAVLMRTLKRRLGDDVEFVGLGGQSMIDEGMDQLFDPARTATMWMWGNLKRIPSHRKALQKAIADWEAKPPDVVVTIDYQAFHLYVGAAARKRGIPVVHFVSSQFWARRYYTLEPIRRAYSHVLVIHEFEKQYYDDANIPATYVGNPLLDRMGERKLDERFMERLRKALEPRLGLLPGSRGGEITGCLPVMLDAARRLDPQPYLAVSCGRPESRPFVEQELKRSGLPGEVADYSTGEILSTSTVALITSGSASMEAVYYGCPAVVVYRLSALSYFFAKPHITSAIAQPNLIAGHTIVPEFLVPTRSGRKVAAAAAHLLANEAAREQQKREFAAVRNRLLAGPHPFEAAADVIVSYVKSPEPA